MSDWLPRRRRTRTPTEDRGSTPGEQTAVPVFTAPQLPSVLGTGPRPGARVTTGTALLRHPLLALVSMALVLVPTLAFAVTRAPVYTAESRLLVGQIDVEAQAVPGFAQATQQLASLYARVVSTDVVVGPVAEDLGLEVETVQGAVRASPIPQSAVIRIEADAPDEARAVAIADASAQQLQRYIDQLNDSDPTESPVFEELTTANGELAAAQVEVRALQAQVDSLRSLLDRALAGEAVAQGPEVIQANLDVAESALVAATSTALQAGSRASLLQEEFDRLARGAGDRAGVDVIGTPIGAASDAMSVGLASLVGGLVGAVLLALGVVTARANLPHLRALRVEARRPRHSGPRPSRSARPALSGR